MNPANTVSLGQYSHPGGRAYNEDRAAVETLTTAGGVSLALAAVCDGVGGQQRGERAAQLAVDMVRERMRQSTTRDMPQLITETVRAANEAIMHEGQHLPRGNRMACTLVLAVLVEGKTLHLGNVGDSRAYLCRDNKLTPLTHDHTLANVMVWTGQLSAEAAHGRPDAGVVMRALGASETVQVDQGLYLTTSDYGEANRIGRNGLTLQPGDSILLCSDGLMKPTPHSQQTLITAKEICDVLKTMAGDWAARAIVSLALGRMPAGEEIDNVTVALLQPAARDRATGPLEMAQQQQRRLRRALTLITVPLLAVVIALGATLVLLITDTRTQFATIEARLAGATALAMAQTQTVAAFTPTSTPPPPTSTATGTPIPTSAPGEVAQLYATGAAATAVFDDSGLIQAPANAARLLVVNRAQGDDAARVYLDRGAGVQLHSLSETRFTLRVHAGSRLIVHTGELADGAEVELAGSSFFMRVRGCAAVSFVEARAATFICLTGQCGVSATFGLNFSELTAGWQLPVDPQAGFAQRARVLPAEAGSVWWNLLQRTRNGRPETARCNLAPPPTPTASLAPTLIPAEPPPTEAVTPEPPTSTPEITPTAGS